MRTVKLLSSKARAEAFGVFGNSDLEVTTKSNDDVSPTGNFIIVCPKEFAPDMGLHFTESEALELAFALFDTVGELKPELIKTEE